MTNGRLLLAVLLAGLAGCLGAIAADRWLSHEDNGSLHQFVHEELVLTEDQNARLETLEARFAVERAELESSLRAANARLAQAMADEHEYGPEVIPEKLHWFKWEAYTTWISGFVLLIIIYYLNI